MTRSFDLIIFDWDGTLMDSADKICRCMAGAVRACGIADPGPEATRHIIGLGLAEALKTLFPTISSVERTLVADHYRRLFLTEDQTETLLFPGVREGLETLRASGYQMAVATGKSRRGLERAMAESGTAGFFLASRCADESHSKPDPAMLEDLLTLSGVSRDRSLMVGDTTYDMQMAVNARMARLAVSYGVHSREQLLGMTPLACVDSFLELCRHLT